MKPEQIVDRESYVQFRREWKIKYNFISDEIRASKREGNALNWRRKDRKSTRLNSSH